MKAIIAGVLIWFIVVSAVATGWSLNLYKLTQTDFEAPYKTEIIRVVSIIPVIGMFTGWMTIGEEKGEETTEN